MNISSTLKASVALLQQVFSLIFILQDSPMREPAEHFLTLRAFGAPPVVIALAAQGTFRGFKDTKTPLYAIGKYYVNFPIIQAYTCPHSETSCLIGTESCSLLESYILCWLLTQFLI